MKEQHHSSDLKLGLVKWKKRHAQARYENIRPEDPPSFPLASLQSHLTQTTNSFKATIYYFIVKWF